MKRRYRFFAVCLILTLLLTGIQACDSKKAEQELPAEQETSAPEQDSFEDQTEAGDETPETVPLSDTVRWFNASYAVLTDLNNWDYTLFGGMEATESSKSLVQKLLDEWWGVTDRATADETLQWILEEGHRVEFVEMMQYLEECGIAEEEEDRRLNFMLENFDIETEVAEMYVNCYKAYTERGENCIAGWDYCRALNLMSYYYVAGYYTEEEALDKSLEIAETAQPLFTSWDDLIDSYMYGYEYWAEESSDDRRAVYEDLKSRDDNPYVVDYQITLEKTW